MSVLTAHKQSTHEEFREGLSFLITWQALVAYFIPNAKYWNSKPSTRKACSLFEVAQNVRHSGFESVIIFESIAKKKTVLNSI